MRVCWVGESKEWKRLQQSSLIKRQMCYVCDRGEERLGGN